MQQQSGALHLPRFLHSDDENGWLLLTASVNAKVCRMSISLVYQDVCNNI